MHIRVSNVNLKVFSQPVTHQIFSSLLRLVGGSVLTSALLYAGPSYALARDINWDNLNLTQQQEVQIDRLEGNWEKTHHEVNTQIEKDMVELKTLLPIGDTQRIRQLQNRITTNKMYLMNESMNTFLKKREMLTPSQHQTNINIFRDWVTSFFSVGAYKGY
jgi:hypothetical protein